MILDAAYICFFTTQLIHTCPVAALKHSPSKRKSVKTKVATSGPGAQNSKSGVIEASQERSGAPPNNEGESRLRQII